MRDSLALALVRAERCRVASTRWAVPTETKAPDIIEASELLLRLAMTLRRDIRAIIACRRRSALRTVPPR